MSNEVKKLKDLAAKTIEEIHPLLVDTAKTIHGFAEIQYQEFKSSKLLADRLADMGFEVERGAGGLETAFAARYGKNSPCMAFIAEYDALPNIGHGCGHNLIGPGAIGAAAAIKSLIDQGRVSGSVAVMGTPAEEGGGGKIPMVEKGVFEGVDASVLIHPGQGNIFDVGSRAKRSFNLEFFGQSSHASADPEKGINALEALIQTFVGINAIRQHVEDSVRIHGIITHGGDAPNVVPGYTSGKFIVRADTMPQVDQVFEKVMGCIKGASLASGCTHNYTGQAEVHIAGSKRKKSRWERMWRRRRAAVEPVISHAKHDNRMNRNHLKGIEGDQINAILSACGYNLRKLVRASFWPDFLKAFLDSFRSFSALIKISKPVNGRLIHSVS